MCSSLHLEKQQGTTNKMLGCHGRNRMPWKINLPWAGARQSRTPNPWISLRFRFLFPLLIRRASRGMRSTIKQVWTCLLSISQFVIIVVTLPKYNRNCMGISNTNHFQMPCLVFEKPNQLFLDHFVWEELKNTPEIHLTVVSCWFLKSRTGTPCYVLFVNDYSYVRLRNALTF